MPLISDGVPVVAAGETGNQTDALVHTVGALIANNDRYQTDDWSVIAVVADLVDNREATYGYVFRDDGDWEARIPSGFGVLDAFLDLRSAMGAQTGRNWLRALVHITRATGAINIQFEYDNPRRWQIVPGDLDQSIDALRP